MATAQAEQSYLESFINSKCHPSKKCPNVYTPRCRTTFDDDLWLKKVEVGRKDKTKREKVIMIVGGTGSGKTTTINAMLNLIMGVEFEDQFRLRLIEEADEDDQTKSVTKYITAYTIHHQPGFKTDYTLTIIDTPGFGDTSGLNRDDEIKKHFSLLREKKNMMYRVHHPYRVHSHFKTFILTNPSSSETKK